MPDLVVEGTTLTSEGPQPVSIGIQDDRFVEPDGSPDLTFEEGYILPAAVDAHVHFREPGATHKEDIATGTASAAFGGVALACDMPNTEPATTERELYVAKANRVEANALVDVGLWAGVGPDMACFELGDEATGYKLYAGPTTGDLLIPDAEGWVTAVDHVAETGRPMAVHAEDPDILADARTQEDNPNEPGSHARMRPPEAEVRVVERLAPRAVEQGARLHVAHTSDPRTVDVVEEHGLTCEVTPHHVLLDGEDVDELGSLGKCNPPIRGPRVKDKLWQALVGGRIDCVASDHAPHTLEEKSGDFDEAPSGLPGVETLFPLMLAQALDGTIGIDRVLEACCSAPAELLDAPAGRIEPGLWANLVHVPEDPVQIGSREVHTRCGWTPFEDHLGLFPDHVMARGDWVIEAEDLVAKPGQGRFVGGPGWD